MTHILRVGMLNNFNHTKEENEQLKTYEDNYDVFTNSNSFREITSDYPSIVTVNPYLNKFVMPRGDLSNVKAVRVKYCSGAKPHIMKAFDDAVAWAEEQKIPVLITYMRFPSKKLMLEFTDDQSNYAWEKLYYRQQEHKTWPNKPNIHYCDLEKKGCPSCMNCAKLTFNTNKAILHGINLSSSGVCKFNCPGCFAKRLTKVFGLTFDSVTQNGKQRGHE